eukprot:CAMPEP_0194523548 /NCGR_PEP_ID=MMETSP0253-20130528/58452_1 /TAXON_ID=2966 /ORGANISM="Noctiluca scintillans" /LENGTH=211 /DNA_ID=CAMNT_0039368095 /DNA_START=24 /DNA_END=659 /DNA_ORIENTATION=+
MTRWTLPSNSISCSAHANQLISRMQIWWWCEEPCDDWAEIADDEHHSDMPTSVSFKSPRPTRELRRGPLRGGPPQRSNDCIFRPSIEHRDETLLNKNLVSLINVAHRVTVKQDGSLIIFTLPSPTPHSVAKISERNGNLDLSLPQRRVLISVYLDRDHSGISRKSSEMLRFWLFWQQCVRRTRTSNVGDSTELPSDVPRLTGTEDVRRTNT